MTYDVLDQVLGITLRPTEAVEFDSQNGPGDWLADSGRVRFDGNMVGKNSCWSHPCLRLTHKVVQQVFHGLVDGNKLNREGVTAVWAMTHGATYVPDWRGK